MWIIILARWRSLYRMANCFPSLYCTLWLCVHGCVEQRLGWILNPLFGSAGYVPALYTDWWHMWRWLASPTNRGTTSNRVRISKRAMLAQVSWIPSRCRKVVKTVLPTSTESCLPQLLGTLLFTPTCLQEGVVMTDNVLSHNKTCSECHSWKLKQLLCLVRQRFHF